MNKQQIGLAIQAERKKQKLSQTTLATKAGITRYQQIIEIEKAQYDYGIDVLLKVTGALGLNVVLNETKANAKVANIVFDFSKVKAAIAEKETIKHKPKKRKK